MLTEIIKQQHHDLAELFSLHQQALLKANFEAAQHWLEVYKTCLNIHMQLEEQYLFPEFEKIERQSKWDVSLYEKEHEKINHLFKAMQDDLHWLSEQTFDESTLNKNIIALLDKEKTLKGLCEHHEAREEEALLMELDKQLDERSKRELKLDINLTWSEAKALVKES